MNNKTADPEISAIWCKYFTVPWPTLSEAERLILLKESRGHKELVKASRDLPTNKLFNDGNSVTTSKKSLQALSDNLEDVAKKIDGLTEQVCGALAVLKYLTGQETVKDNP